MMRKIFTEDNHQDPVIDFTGVDSLARQEFRDEANINNIIKRYQATGFLIDPSVVRSCKPIFGDFASVPDFEAAQQILIKAQQQFDALPVELRKRFNYDPRELLAFVADHANFDEAISLGIIENPTKSASATENARRGSAEAEPTDIKTPARD